MVDTECRGRGGALEEGWQQATRHTIVRASSRAWSFTARPRLESSQPDHHNTALDRDRGGNDPCGIDPAANRSNRRQRESHRSARAAGECQASSAAGPGDTLEAGDWFNCQQNDSGDDGYLYICTNLRAADGDVNHDEISRCNDI